MILERNAELALLTGLLDATAVSGGRVVLIRGEAGIGKSTLINHFIQASADRSTALLGFCDDLLTPQPFGPMWDIARSEPTLRQPLESGDQRAVMHAALDLLSTPGRTAVMVLEDTQWADEATLDLITFLGRRIARSNGLLVLSYRDVEVDADHPLRRVLGELPVPSVIRMPLRRLSAAAVSSMMAGRDVDVDAILELTAGNPLFVTQVLASEGEAVPISIQEAVLARAALLSPEARAVLDLVAVVPGATEIELLRWILDPAPADLAACARCGLLDVGDGEVAFAHDLQRRAIESALSETQRSHLNQQVLDALCVEGDTGADAARLVHHAQQAGDVDALVRVAPRAASEAMAMASTTEAIAHFRSLGPHLDRFDPAQRGDLLCDWARQESFADHTDAVDLFDRAIETLRSLDDPFRLATALTASFSVYRNFGLQERAMDHASEAVSILEPFGPSPELARSLAQLAYAVFVYLDDDRTLAPLIDRALLAAERVGDDAARVQVLMVRSQTLYSRGDSAAVSLMQECVRLAQLLGDHWSETRALGNLASMYADARDVERAIDYTQRSSDTASRYQLRSLENLARVLRAELDLWTGDWAAAENAATDVLGSSSFIDDIAWRLLANVSVRTGRHEAPAMAYRLSSRVDLNGGLTVADPAAAAVAEYLWLSGDDAPGIVEQLDRILAAGIELGAPWPSGAFAFWMWKLGRLHEAPDGTADFYAWIMRGEYARSATFFAARGLHYDEALALMHGTEAEQIRAVRIFDDLGAVAASARVRQLLVDQGTRLTRGQSRATRRHPAGLTPRQAEVLLLLAQRFTNGEIADKLFVSLRTVENHVSAVLMKLDVSTREAAVRAALDQGLLVSADVAGPPAPADLVADPTGRT